LVQHALLELGGIKVAAPPATAHVPRPAAHVVRPARPTGAATHVARPARAAESTRPAGATRSAGSAGSAAIILRASQERRQPERQRG
jgi:hypothetical protein